jgi:hypothetical protein
LFVFHYYLIFTIQALVEILLLSGGTPYANFKDLAYGWGREKGFHHVLASSVCERRGEVERKRRCDAGKVMSNEQREAFRQKLKRTRGATTLTPGQSSTTIGVSDNDNHNHNPPTTTTTGATTTTGTTTTTTAAMAKEEEEEEEEEEAHHHAMEEDEEDAATVQV